MEKDKFYYIRTLTDHWIGRVVEVRGYEVIIDQAAWVADSGYLADFVAKGKATNMEIEALPKELKMGVQYLTWIEWPHGPLKTVRG